jgi:hypothetical protein
MSTPTLVEHRVLSLLGHPNALTEAAHSVREARENRVNPTALAFHEAVLIEVERRLAARRRPRPYVSTGTEWPKVLS